jgi:Xaa-Pro aminopeptidase
MDNPHMTKRLNKDTKNPHASDTMKAGQIVTVGPGIYMAGKLGIRLEDDVMITDNGCQVLPQACKHFRRLEDCTG